MGKSLFLWQFNILCPFKNITSSMDQSQSVARMGCFPALFQLLVPIRLAAFKVEKGTASNSPSFSLVEAIGLSFQCID